jgi:hypothetical protein
MRFGFKADDLTKSLGEVGGNTARALTGAMRDGGPQGDLRSHVVDGGMGQRLANTWRRPSRCSDSSGR